METALARQITPEEAWQITCHEAGHAVTGVRLRFAFLRVERGDGEYGRVDVGVGPIEAPTGNWTEVEISRWQLFYAGGAAAERMLFGDHRQYACRHDHGLHDRLEKHRHQSRNDAWERDIQSAVVLLDRESVEKVAKELDRSGTLSGEQVYQLLGCATPWD